MSEAPAGKPLKTPNDRPPMALAMEWVAKITTVSLEMVLPGIFGQWLDAKLGTSFLVFVGFALGLSGGLWHLLRMTATSTSVKRSGSIEQKKSRPRDDRPSSGDGPGAGESDKSR